MSGVNSCTFIGNLTRDPEIRQSKGGDSIANFSIACNKRWNGEDHVEFINIVAFKKLAEICGEYLSKGKKVYIQGEMKTSSWDDKDTGAKRYKTEIIANQMVMLDSKGDTSQREPQQADTQPDMEDIDF